MKGVTVVIAVLVVIGMLLTSGLAQTAADKMAPPEKIEKETMQAKTFSGVITNIEAAANRITIRGKAKEMTFDVGGAKVEGDLKKGDNVNVEYMEEGGRMKARAVSMARK